MAEDQGPWGKAQAEARAQAAQVAPAAPPARPIGLYIWLGLLAAAGIGFALMATLMPNRLSPSDWGNAWADFGFLALVSAGLIRLRGTRTSTLARNAAIWLAIIGVLALGYAYRNELTDAGQRLQAEIFPDHAVSAKPHEMVILPDADGQFAIMGSVNGQAIRFVIDTGASRIVLSPDDAAKLGVDVGALKFSHPVATANGAGAGADFKLASLQVGAARFTDVDASINRVPMDGSLLGMTFLKRFESVEVRDGRMFLRWRG